MKFEEKRIYISKDATIFCNNKELTEIEFLSFIGLDDKAKKIIDDYNATLRRATKEIKGM